jgi:hypothetical protein
MLFFGLYIFLKKRFPSSTTPTHSFFHELLCKQNFFKLNCLLFVQFDDAHVAVKLVDSLMGDIFVIEFHSFFKPVLYYGEMISNSTKNI